MNKLLRRAWMKRAQRPGSRSRSATLTVLIAFSAIGGLHGIAEVIKALSTLVASDSGGCEHAPGRPLD